MNSMRVLEYYNMHPMAANASYILTNGRIHGFLPTVTGTLTLTDGNGNVLINAVPVTAGIFLWIPGMWNIQDVKRDATLTLAGGAAGTLFL